MFDKSEITGVCDRVLGAGAKAEDIGEFERTELEGRTCFAQLTLDAKGQLLLEPARSGPVSYVSTLPWALGQLEKGGLASLSSSSFEIAKQDLAGELLSFHAARRARATSNRSGESASLTAADILDLQRIFEDWAAFSPPNTNPIAVQVVVVGKKLKQIEREKDPDDTELSEATQDATNIEIGILNSFYIQDIEKALSAIHAGEISSALKAFLLPLLTKDRIDLDSTSGLRTLLTTLHPSRFNRGRWFSDTKRSMSLMQQFAINLVTERSTSVPSLFSINGPPGTGKTTLLQEVFADLIVRRARVLAGLNRPSDAFLPEKLRVAFKGGTERTISVLKPALTGFEIVVASSNNAAVENISGDLPKAGKLGPGWNDQTYIRSVAYKVAAQKVDGAIKALREEDIPWGLISCALGKSGNRRYFKERFCYMDVAKNHKGPWQIPDRPQQVRDWIDSYSGRDFEAARSAFLRGYEKTEAAFLQLETLADLLADRIDSANKSCVSAARQQVQSCQRESSHCEKEIEDLSASVRQLQDSLVELREDERLLDRDRPAWWAKLLRTQAARQHRSRVSENAFAQLEIRRQVGGLKAKIEHELRPRAIAVTDQLRLLEQEIARAEAKERSDEERFRAAKAGLPSLPLPNRLEDLRTDELQKSGLWDTEDLAQKRSELFAAALSLHEAWIAAVGKAKAGFRPNILAIADLLSGHRLEDPSNALPIWQSLFLITPIVSTTFASFHSQFGDLEAASLGWLFIDEAGQAVPQAAVGAMFRAQRAVVIGDPLQIEPVFTLPSRFISAIAELSPYTAQGSYSPHRTSVQELADKANRFGVFLGREDDDPLWVGSPLRVHRRCIDPMFSWSNSIAYQDKMVFGLSNRVEPDQPPIAHESTWIDIRGPVGNRQEVVEQTKFVAELLVALYRRDWKLPNLYLISPFKAIKSGMTRRIIDSVWVEEGQGVRPPAQSELEKWCKERVGTVHTFQGKEEDSVLFVLGADARHASSANWACAKPNIVNVALTRARRRFYVVGDRAVWGGLRPFLWAVDQLPTTSADDFLSVISDIPTRGRSAGV